MRVEIIETSSLGDLSYVVIHVIRRSLLTHSETSTG